MRTHPARVRLHLSRYAPMMDNPLGQQQIPLQPQVRYPIQKVANTLPQ